MAFPFAALIPLATSLFTGLMGSRSNNGTGGTGGTGGEIDSLLASLMPGYNEMFNMETAKQKASLPLYNAVLNQAFGGLPSWSRNGVPGVERLGVTPEMLAGLGGGRQIGMGQPGQTISPPGQNTFPEWAPFPGPQAPQG